MLGALLGIGKQAGFVGNILLAGGAAGARAGDRADGDFTFTHAHQNLGARSDQRKARQIEKIEERRGVHPPQCAVKRERGEREGAGEALGQHHLEDVSGKDVVLRLQCHCLVVLCRDHRCKIG